MGGWIKQSGQSQDQRSWPFLAALNRR